ncbi:MAG TPA: VWA domain-containing protein [Chromatiales bacterium]|nr:VWA domain-containing protein [Chromatiales bacterium]
MSELPLQFEWPWLLWLMPLPLLVRWLLPAVASDNEAVLRVPFLNDFKTAATTRSNTLAGARWALWLALLAWVLLVIATARPQWQGDAVELPVSGRDLMLAVDLSGSMEVEDFEWQGRMVNRLVATQLVAGEFIERRVGDRLGLILFGQQAYLQTPLTFDRTTVRTLLDEAVIGLAGQATAIGDAIGLAVKRLRENSSASRVLILLTDGANTAGEIEPLKAAELAASEGLKIYTIGIGADEMMVRSLFGSRKVNPSADLDEATLTAIATTTGGRYFRARDLMQLEEIYQLLDELEPVAQEKQFFRPRHALYPWPLAGAMLIASLLLWRHGRMRGAV